MAPLLGHHGTLISYRMNKFFITVAFLAITLCVTAQSGTNSPYSQYGFGTQAELANGISRGMNGLGIGYRSGTQVNILNPASYSAIDSLTFLFDAGLSAQITNFEENGKKINANNANFEYAVGGFRLMKHLGVSFGILPFTNVGYSYSSTSKIDDISATTFTNTYSGSGGLHQVFVGFGWELFKGLSIGVNGAYLWGKYEKSIVNSYSDTYVNTLSKYYTANITNYKVDFGVQTVLPLSKKNTLTIGATYGLQHKLGADPQCQIISRNSQTSVSDTATVVAKNGLELPAVISAGLMFNFNNKLKIGADYQLQQWSKVGFPDYKNDATTNTPTYTIKKDYFDDRHKVTVGGEYCKNANSRNFFDRIAFRMGASYATPYLNINGKDGPKEISVSAGLGIPIINVWNNRSTLNISGQWVRMDASNLITENTFRINVGITFNERWFMKWKVD